ncbi:hypothetical protein LOK46_32615 (plasmid) [Methylobacterium sp. NMS14P]|uniref:hypothetical protein n=1 Tax=Methylobacterium sp. NMS14P TaxID=2894310 RepID=UPI0023580F55|nr:hypothetical protein [Methylobacterium sp. NMS14P]WCS28856.1 hypothetical protein LOK46_32615 [Methylobacterium sp. NMS14P]
MIVLTFSTPAWAQVGDSVRLTDSAALNTRNDIDTAPNETPDISIIVHDATGEFGAAVPIEVKIIPTKMVVVQAIRLLGLPSGTTISDDVNTFSPSEDNDDIDLSSWDISKLQITHKDKRNKNFTLTIAAIWTLKNGGRLDVTTSRFNVSFVQGSWDRAAAASSGPSSSKRPAAQIRETTPANQRVAAIFSHDASVSGVFAPEVRARHLEGPVVVKHPEVPAVAEGEPSAEAKAAALPRSPASPQPTSRVDPLVERAKGLIRLGDISGARLLLERARVRNAPNATFLLAQTWDPVMLRTWRVRGLQADPDLARSLYARAAGEEGPDERLLAATGR